MLVHKKRNAKLYQRWVGVVAFAVFFSFAGTVAQAATVHQAADALKSEGSFTPRHTENTYVEATNTFSGENVKYYLLTHDAAKQTLTEVTYAGTVYPLESVTVVAADDFDFKSLDFKNKDGTMTKLLNYTVASKDYTIFFDDGIYNNTDSTDYTGLSKENASYVGLNKAANGDPAVVISKNPRSGTGNANIDGKMERWIFMHKNIYIENLRFDAKGKDMYPVGGGSGSSKVPQNRGEYFFTITGGGVEKGCDGFVMRDVVLENIGADSSTEYPAFWGVDTRNKNIAINVLYNPGRVNIENLKVRNIKTTEGYGILQSEYVDDLFYKNIELDASAANVKSRSIKIEQSGTQTAGQATYVAPENQGVVFSGNINLPASEMHNHIYVQDYRYKYVKAPADFRYAAWNMSNGTYFNAAFEMHKNRPATADNRALQDLEDHYWVVNANADAPVTIEEQLKDILTVINYAKMPDTTPRAPQANIKLVTQTTIPSFTVPDGFAAMNTQIVAVKEYTALYDAKELVPVAQDAFITLPASNNVKLYNFDFHENAKITMHEAVQGITALNADMLNDPLQTSDLGGAAYPKYETYALNLPSAARVSNSSKDFSFVNCKFTVLAKSIQIGNAPPDKTLTTGQDWSLQALFLSGYSLGTITDIAGNPIDNQDVIWVSGDPAIASVDANGLVHAVANGTVKIYLKAIDSNNGGEIEKPFDAVDLIIKRPATLLYEFQSATQGKDLPAEVAALLPANKNTFYGEVETPIAPAQAAVALAEGKWVFQGWEPATVTISNDSEKFIGRWAFEANTVSIGYLFQSGTAGVEIPNEVKNLLPAAVLANYGETITPAAPASTSVETQNGTWTFQGWNLAQIVAGVQAESQFIGTWTFTERVVVPKYQVIYEFLATAAGETLPQEVLALRPANQSEVENGTAVTPAQPAQTSVAVSGGKWIFQGWNKASDIVAASNVVFSGRWLFEPLPSPSAVSVSVKKNWNDNNNQNGVRPANAMVQLFRNGTAYGSVVTLSGDNGWSYIWSGLSEEYTWTVDEVNIPAAYAKSIANVTRDFTITNTYQPPQAETPQPPAAAQKAKPSRIPKTGDASANSFWLFLMIGSGGMLPLMGFAARRKNLRANKPEK